MCFLIGFAVVGGTSIPAHAQPLLAGAGADLAISTDGGITKPLDDGFRNSVSFTVTSSTQDPVDVVIIDSDGEVVQAIAQDAVPQSAPAGTAFTLRRTFSPTSITVGRYSAVVTDSYSPSRTAAVFFTVGSGRADVVGVSVDYTTLYPYPDGYRDNVIATVTVRDETGTMIPFAGDIDTMVFTKRSSVPLVQTGGGPASATVPLSALPIGPGVLSTLVHTSVGDNEAGKPITVQLAATRVSKITIARQYSTVYPHRDGYRDSTRLTLTTQTSVPRTVPVKGTLVITKGSTTVKTWKITSSKKKAVTWAPSRSLKAGTYKVTATLTNPEGSVTTKSVSITVSNKKR